jgi:hypothetical protein
MMRQPFFLQFSGLCIYLSNLLKHGVKIDSDNDHCSVPFSEPVGWLRTTNFTRE